MLCIPQLHFFLHVKHVQYKILPFVASGCMVSLCISLLLAEMKKNYRETC